MNEIGSLAGAFVSVCFERLRAEGAIPTSTSHRHLQAGLDFEELPLRELPEYARLAEAVLAAAPDTNWHGESESMTSWLLTSFLELCVQECSYAGSYDPLGPEVSAAIVQLTDVLSGQPYDMVLARQISHLVPASGSEIEINGVVIVPEGKGYLNYRILKEIPDADHAWKRHLTQTFRPPHALLMVREQVTGLDYFGAGDLERKLDRFQLGVSLLTGANVQGMYQVFGASSRISAQPASLELLARNSHVTTTRRTARLDGSEGPAIAALTDLVADARSKTVGPDTWLSSFGEALKRFANLDDTTGYGEQIVDLATALEGVVLGTNEGEGLTLRLCTRVAAVLAHDDDPAAVLFEELKQLYSLRSSIVHGGEVSVRSLNGKLRAMECVPSQDEEKNTLVRLGYAVDRLRDIVRRTILARICLARGEEPPWPFDEKGKTGVVKVDSVLADDTMRAAWRAYWRDMLDSLGAGAAARRAAPPVFSLTSDDR
ncbi:HEPN domain-containing protein [Nocardia coubleae]|uniref:Apea-like HEPN domain-containing protein n=1 Tax=Nocardia coubleae TaxID=356147 RepID=A0A846WCM9_9NOCA|nr:HEPN domain-containing protein [Nocardia coubleae]NKX91269.1 hypothetical protein [Nocardia coubleae]